MGKLMAYTDGHVPLAVVKQARRKAREIDIIRCEEIGLKDVDDEVHWTYVLEHQRVLITTDQGFLSRAAELNKQGKSHPGIIFITPGMQGDVCIGPLVELLVFTHEAIESGAATVDQDVENWIEYV